MTVKAPIYDPYDLYPSHGSNRCDRHSAWSSSHIRATPLSEDDGDDEANDEGGDVDDESIKGDDDGQEKDDEGSRKARTEASDEDLTRILADHKTRRFITRSTSIKPCDLFYNVSKEYEPTKSAFFNCKENPEEVLVYISGRHNIRDKAPDRAVYACVWGPRSGNQDHMNQEVCDLDYSNDPQPEQRAQLRAAIKAPETISQISNPKHSPRLRGVVLAYSGHYFHNQVARSTYSDESGNKRNNLDLKEKLARRILTFEDVGIRVHFWWVHEEDNKAENLASDKLYWKKHLLQRGVDAVVNLV